MEITSDILLKGSTWSSTIETLSDIFATRTNYSVFILSLAIGIMYDRRTDFANENNDEVKSVPRNIINNNDNGRLDLFYQAAILTTDTEEFSEDERLNLAFGEKVEFNKIKFLVSFANYGITKIAELIGETTLDTMQNIKDFLIMTVEGDNEENDGFDEIDDLIDFDLFD